MFKLLFRACIIGQVAAVASTITNVTATPMPTAESSFGYSQERAYTEELSENIVVYQDYSQ